MEVEEGAPLVPRDDGGAVAAAPGGGRSLAKGLLAAAIVLASGAALSRSLSARAPTRSSAATSLDAVEDRKEFENVYNIIHGGLLANDEAMSKKNSAGCDIFQITDVYFPTLTPRVSRCAGSRVRG